MYGCAAVPPWKGEITSFIVWQRMQLEKLGVEVRYGTELTGDIVKNEKPDTLVIAAGSQPWAPPVPGLDQDFVISAVDLLRGNVSAEGNVAVIGGGLVGGETANFIATHGSSVSIIEMADEILREEPGNIKKFLLESYDDHGVKVYTGAKVVSVSSDRMIKIEQDGQSAEIGPFDKVVTAVGMRPVETLKQAVDGMDLEIVCVGDSKKPGNALEAIQDGYMTALEI